MALSLDVKTGKLIELIEATTIGKALVLK